MKDLYQDNKLVKGPFELGGRTVDLKRVTCPVLNIFGTKDHLVPPASCRPLSKYVGTSDVETFELPIGHFGMYVSSKSQPVIAPKIVTWLGERSASKPPAKDAAASAQKKTAANKGNHHPKKRTAANQAPAKKK